MEKMQSSSIEVSYEKCYLCGSMFVEMTDMSEKSSESGKKQRPELKRQDNFDLGYADDEDDLIEKLNTKDTKCIIFFGECVGLCDR